MSEITLWLTIIGMGIITYALRISMILLLGRIEIPLIVRRALRFVPPAVLSAIIFPEVLRPRGRFDFSAENFQLLAGILAALVAWRSRNTLLTVGSGMAALWILQWLTK